MRRALTWIGQREFSLLVTVFLVTASVWAFAEVAEYVVEGDSRAFDEAILLALRSPGDPASPLGPGWVEEMGRDFTALGGVAVLTLLTVTVLGYLVLQRKRRAAWAVLIAIVGGQLISMGLKEMFDRPRPDLVPHGSMVYTASFPSGHAMMAAVTYLTLGALLARVHRRRQIKGYILGTAVMLTLLVGVSRVYLGVHWPTDVLAGWAAGAGWALFCWLLMRRLQRQRRIECDDDIGPSDGPP